MIDVTLTPVITGVAYQALLNTEVKGRADGRIHRRIMQALKTSCMKMQPDGVNGSLLGGTVSLDEDSVAYLSDILDTRIKAGVPGGAIEGYLDLDELLTKLKTADPVAPQGN